MLTMKTSNLLSSVRSEIRKTGYDYCTEQAYEKWIRHYIRFQGHPDKFSGNDAAEYLASLSHTEKPKGAAQNQALAAILFLYRRVLHKPLNGLAEFKTKD